ncbi:MAG: tRNA (adenosine(37)-N6)-dimethylallyltransferase MiaA [Phycisphaeraceae bacterium]|nr:tRNA (adenosine(37)-N6)-dimethylallyltransferase MiaA [Phycisphaeraceae bacterium]
MLSRFPVIVGPTASGKSALAVEVALALEARGLPRGEVVSADAFQVYRGMDIGTAKPTADERRGVAHHLIDLVEPDDPEPFTLHRWLTLANSHIDGLRARGATPIVVGGTHLYVKALLDGLFEGPGEDAAIRAELRAMEPAARRRELERADPAAAARIHPNDERRTVRALEVYRLTGKPISDHQSQWDCTPRPDALLVGLEWPTEVLNRRINARVKEMMERGLLVEVRALAPRLGPQASEALGYKQLLTHLEGRATLEEAVEAVKIETRRFAKNQRTWLRRLRETPGSLWLNADGDTPARLAQTVVDAVLAP